MAWVDILIDAPDQLRLNVEAFRAQELEAKRQRSQERALPAAVELDIAS